MKVGFWIFMLIMDLSIPFTMVCLGKYFSKSGPKEINETFGYRTSMSMKNKETWEFAHHYCGKVWLKIGIVIFILSIIAMLFVIGKDTNTVGIFGGILCGVQLIFFIGSMLPTERALKNNFDEHGNRKGI